MIPNPAKNHKTWRIDPDWQSVDPRGRAPLRLAGNGLPDYAVWTSQNIGQFQGLGEAPGVGVVSDGVSYFLSPIGVNGGVTWVAEDVRGSEVEISCWPVADESGAAGRLLANASGLGVVDLEGDEIATVMASRGQSALSAVIVVGNRPEIRIEAELRPPQTASPAQALQTAIRAGTSAITFKEFQAFMDRMFCEPTAMRGEERNALGRARRRLKLPFPDAEAYRQLKVAAEVFLMLRCGVEMGDEWWKDLDFDAESRRYGREVGPSTIEKWWHVITREAKATAPDVDGTIMYLALIRNKLGDISTAPIPGVSPQDAVMCNRILLEKLTHPTLLELIWSYWHEEAMLVQSMNAITWRFQNRRAPGDRDALAPVEIDALRPLNNILWGYIQDEQHRLTLLRRAYEYDHHYGVTLIGRAVPAVRGADSRSQFIEAFHHLLHVCTLFFKELDDTTVVADGFPILNALKEVHLLLAQGAHNQYGDLPWTARQEMLMQQWLLARPEFREFLPRRVMVDYPEPWMDSVESMKTLQAWGGASTLHFRDLGVFGEQILLGVRFGAWPSTIEPVEAANWARYWRPEIQGYVHAYRAVTGVDLTERVDATMPGVLLRQRMQAQLPAAAARRVGGGGGSGLPSARPGVPVRARQR